MAQLLRIHREAVISILQCGAAVLVIAILLALYGRGWLFIALGCGPLLAGCSFLIIRNDSKKPAPSKPSESSTRYWLYILACVAGAVVVGGCSILLIYEGHRTGATVLASLGGIFFIWLMLAKTTPKA